MIGIAENQAICQHRAGTGGPGYYKFVESKVGEMSETHKEKLFTKDYIMLVLFSTVIMVYVQMYLPVMAIYAKLVTGSNFMAGLSPGIFTCASLVAIRCSIPVIKKYGKAGTMAIGSVIMGISAILYFFSRNLYIYLLARIIHGFGNGLCTPANSAAMADVLPKSRLMEGIGYFSVLQTLTGAVAPAMALGLVEGNPSGFNTVFILAFIFSALCFLLSFTITYEKKGLYGANRAEAPKNGETADRKSVV
jgi:MFS family permease